MTNQRTAEVTRNTTETKIRAAVNLDGTGLYEISTGIGFLDHMLEQLSRHSLIDISLTADGDLHIDGHHTTEDTGYAVGEAIHKALGAREGITRFGHAELPMDETLSAVTVDVSGRPHLTWHVSFPNSRLGEMETELFREWFQAFSQACGLTLHVRNFYGENAHHIVESCYKGLGRAIRQAIQLDSRTIGVIPSTKGSLGGSKKES